MKKLFIILFVGILSLLTSCASEYKEPVISGKIIEDNTVVYEWQDFYNDWLVEDQVVFEGEIDGGLIGLNYYGEWSEWYFYSETPINTVRTVGSRFDLNHDGIVNLEDWALFAAGEYSFGEMD